MKKIIFGLCLGLLSHTSFAQALPDFEAIKLEQKEDFNPAASDAALKAANFLLSSPLEEGNINRLKSLQYIMQWMSGTPDYTFNIEEPVAKLAEDNTDLLGLYMAAMTKYVLENKADANDQDKIKLNAARLIIAYAKDEKNKVKMNAELKKAIKAEDKGQLSAYLKM